MSTEKSHKSTKICQSCGLEKPLAAFIQKTGLMGGVYGNICSTCRSELERAGRKKTDESGTTSGKNIDAEAKIEADVSKREKLERESEEYYDEREKTSELTTKRVEKNIEKTTTEQKIRSFLEKKTAQPEKKPVDTNQNTLEKLAEREGVLDSSEATQDTRVEGKRKYQSQPYLDFLRRVKGSPHSKMLDTAVDRMEKNLKAIQDLPTTEEKIQELDHPTKPGSRRR